MDIGTFIEDASERQLWEACTERQRRWVHDAWLDHLIALRGYELAEALDAIADAAPGERTGLWKDLQRLLLGDYLAERDSRVVEMAVQGRIHPPEPDE